jgi:serine/threonine-protein kinase
MRSATSSGLRTGTLSPELEAAAARRLGSLALIVAALGVVVETLQQLGLGASSGHGAGLRMGSTAVSIALSLALHAAIARGRLSPGAALRLAGPFEVVQAFTMALGFRAMAMESGSVVLGYSPVAVWALIFPLIVPGPTRRVVLATAATTAMDPLGIWLNAAIGGRVPPSFLLSLLPTAVACVVAPITARILYGLTVEVTRAREMGSYHLLDKLGQGGMGEVWRAEHRMLARGAAIKLIRPAVLGAGGQEQAGEVLKRFEREARATAALRSPHTIEIYDYGIAADGTFHYVMELLEGFSLQTLVDRFGPVPPARAVSLLRQACHSLAEAHAAGLVHRDVKPANLFVCRLGLDVDFVKVLDFGLVKTRGVAAFGGESLTIEGAFTGTPGYMPPEVAVGADIDGRADIYALGCVAYWLLTGELVFEGRTAMQMVVDHVKTAPVPPSRRARQAIPADLERIVLRCLEKEPSARPASVAELSRELAGLGLHEQWSEDRAREWWRTHEPAARVDEADATLEMERHRAVRRRTAGDRAPDSAWNTLAARTPGQ